MKIYIDFENCKVAVFDRPWNQDAEFPNANFVRCFSWQEINELLGTSGVV